ISITVGGDAVAGVTCAAIRFPFPGERALHYSRMQEPPAGIVAKGPARDASPYDMIFAYRDRITRADVPTEDARVASALGQLISVRCQWQEQRSHARNQNSS